MRWGLACLLVLALTAGCNALGGSAAPGTLTPAPVPTDTPTPRTPATVAPGVTTAGIENRSRLVRGHVRAVRETSWVWTESSVIRQTYDNETVNTSRTRTIRYVDRRRYRREATRVSVGPDGLVDFFQRNGRYADGDVAYDFRRTTGTIGAVYSRDDSPAVNRSFAGFGTVPVRNYLALESATVSRVDVGEQPHYAVVGTRSTMPNLGRVTTYRARAVVRADGFVRRLDVTYSFEQSDFRVEATYEFAYRGVGTTTIDRPDWVDTAENRTEP